MQSVFVTCGRPRGLIWAFFANCHGNEPPVPTLGWVVVARRGGGGGWQEEDCGMRGMGAAALLVVCCRGVKERDRANRTQPGGV